MHADPQRAPHETAIAVGGDHIIGGHGRRRAGGDIAQDGLDAIVVLANARKLGREPDVSAESARVAQ
jgi:hypothetical protein